MRDRVPVLWTLASGDPVPWMEVKWIRLDGSPIDVETENWVRIQRFASLSYWTIGSPSLFVSHSHSPSSAKLDGAEPKVQH